MLPSLKKQETGAPASSGLGQRSERSAPSVIGPDLLITGNLMSRGEVQIDGEIQGDVHAHNLVVGDTARITGGIVADEVVVRGHVMGSVRGKRVLLQNSSHVEGDVYHQTLAIEQGAFFEGKSRRTQDPTAGIGTFQQQQQPAQPPTIPKQPQPPTS
jgi:cytoskeletal protein CcmA (bactofilin family)